jgi:hypothetical protein
VPLVKLETVARWLKDDRAIAAGAGLIAGFLIALLIFGKPWHLPPAWGDVPTWLAAFFAGIAGIAAVTQLGMLRRQLSDEVTRNVTRDKLMDRQLAEAERRAEADLRRQAEDIEVTWLRAAIGGVGYVTTGIVTDKSRRPISRISCRVMSKVDGAALKLPHESGFMPFVQGDAHNGVLVEKKPLQEFAVLGPNAACGFAFKDLPPTVAASRLSSEASAIAWSTASGGTWRAFGVAVV